MTTKGYVPDQFGVWGYDGTDWRPLLVNAAGALHVVPGAGATFATHCYGYDDGAWQRLRVETAANANLRVRLYYGATAVSGLGWGTAGLTYSEVKGLAISNLNFLVSHATVAYPWYAGEYLADGTGGRGQGTVCLYGYNGATWDRLRTYGTGILKVGRAEVGLLTVRRIGTGQVGAAGARKLYWMVLNPSAGNSLFELSDAAAALQPIVLDHFDTTRDGHIMTFDPPMEFSTGIYLETLTNITSIIFGYL